MIPVLYIPWFREKNHNKRNPGFRLEEYCNSIWADFQRVVLPGDTDSWDKSSFSMSWFTDRINEAFSDQSKKCKIVSYSLSALPTLEVLSMYTETLSQRVEDILFLHPAWSPVYSVAMMDWALRWAHSSPYSLDHFLKWDPEEVFTNLIWDWKWDAKEFQQDLNEYYNAVQKHFSWDEHLAFSFRTSFWDISKVPIKIYDNENDIIAHPISEKLWVWKRAAAKAQREHIPKLSGEEIYNFFLNPQSEI